MAFIYLVCTRWIRSVSFAVGLLTLLLWVQPRGAHAKACPNLVILLDQSASMAQNPQGVLMPQGSPDSKWAIATRALSEMNLRYDRLLPLGYSNFPTGVGCPVNATVPIQPGYNNLVAIHNAMIAYPFPGGSTPTCEAVRQTASDLVGKYKNPSYLLLVTDGEPDALCCGANPVKATVDAIAAAAKPTVPGVSPVYTLVVGFGKTLDSERLVLNQMADAGGYPVTTDPNYRYYRAEDKTALEQALARIVKSVTGGDAGVAETCEDGCYAKGCPQGQVCYKSDCRANPCASKTCPSSEYCVPTFNADGTATAACVAACVHPCPVTSRCDKGQCVGDPCSGQCQSGQKCQASPDGGTGTCVSEPLCALTLCHNTQGCFVSNDTGQCKDDSCRYITCPLDTVCRPFSGSCQSPDPQPIFGLGSGGIGCSTGGGTTSALRLSLLSSGLLLSLLFLGRKRAGTGLWRW